MKRRIGSTAGFWAATVCLVLVTAFCIAGTARSQGDMEERELAQFYQVKERQLVEDVKDFLEKKGYVDSGVALTRVVKEDGARDYTITIHHGKIDEMDDFSRQALKNELSGFAFFAENCNFYHEFLITD